MRQKTDRVIAEILQKRDRFTKNFRTENHGGAAVIYGYPVHYKEGEEWKEIDNRLEKTENGYQNHASRVKVHFAESSNANEMVTIEKMGRKLSWGFLAEKQKKEFINYYKGKEVSVLFEDPVEVDGVRYFEGLTPEYVKVWVPTEENLANRIMTVEFFPYLY